MGCVAKVGPVERYVHWEGIGGALVNGAGAETEKDVNAPGKENNAPFMSEFVTAEFAAAAAIGFFSIGRRKEPDALCTR